MRSGGSGGGARTAGKQRQDAAWWDGHAAGILLSQL